MKLKLSVIAVANSCLLLFCKKAAVAEIDVEELGGCKDPLAATLNTLQCIADSNVTCAGAGYNTVEFKKYHNGEDTNTMIDGTTFWEGVLTLTSLSFTYDHTMNVGHNMASIRYVEYVNFTDGTSVGLPASSEYPWSAKVVQHEHALVTVDDECRIKTWDQYGDNKEQAEADDVSAAIFAELCAKQIAPPEMCEPPSSISSVTNENAAAMEENAEESC